MQGTAEFLPIRMICSCWTYTLEACSLGVRNPNTRAGFVSQERRVGVDGAGSCFGAEKHLDFGPVLECRLHLLVEEGKAVVPRRPRNRDTAFADHLLARAQLRGGDPEGGVAPVSLFDAATMLGYSDANPLFEGHCASPHQEVTDYCIISYYSICVNLF